MSAGFDVNLQSLQTHAGKVETVARRVDVAARAAKTVDLGGAGTYGLLCSTIIIPALEGFFGDTVDIIDTLSDMGNAYSEAIDHQHLQYDDMEKRNKALFSRLGLDDA